MELQHWVESLKSELRQQGLPRDYIERFAAEITDHATDQFQNELSQATEWDMEARLGTPATLAKTALREFQRRTFAGRNPGLVFVVGPGLSIAAAMIVSVMLLGAFAWSFELFMGHQFLNADPAGAPPTPGEMVFIRGLELYFRFIPFAVSSWFLFRLARNAGRVSWGFWSSAIVSTIAALFQSELWVGGDGHGYWNLGFGWRNGIISLDQLLQAFVPVGIAAWMSFRWHWVQNSPLPAS